MYKFAKEFSLFRNRQFTLLLTARTISTLGNTFAPVAVAFGILGLDPANTGPLSAVLIAQSVAQLVCFLAGGVIADRIPRHLLMGLAELVGCCAYAGLAFMLSTENAPLFGLIGCGALAGSAMALFLPAATGVMPDIVPTADLQASNSLLRFGTNIASMAGFALSGLTVTFLGAGTALALDAASFAISAVLIAALRIPRRIVAGTQSGNSQNQGITSFFHDLRDGWREFISRQWLWLVVLQCGLDVAACHAMYGVLGPLVAQDHYGGAIAWSAALCAETLGTVIGAAIAMRIQPRRPILVAVLVQIGAAIQPTLLGLPVWWIFVVSGSFVAGIALENFNVLWETTVQREVPKEKLSRVSSYDYFGSFLLGPVGLAVGAFAAPQFGARVSLLGCAAIMGISAAALLLFPQIRHLTTPKPTLAHEPEQTSARALESASNA